MLSSIRRPNSILLKQNYPTAICVVICLFSALRDKYRLLHFLLSDGPVWFAPFPLSEMEYHLPHFCSQRRSIIYPFSTLRAKCGLPPFPLSGTSAVSPFSTLRDENHLPLFRSEGPVSILCGLPLFRSLRLVSFTPFPLSGTSIGISTTRRGAFPSFTTARITPIRPEFSIT